MFESVKNDELVKLKEIVGSENEYDTIQEEANAVLFADIYLGECGDIDLNKTNLIPYSEIFSTESENYIKMESHKLGFEYQKMNARRFILHLAKNFYEFVDNALFNGEFERGSHSHFRGQYELECYFKRKTRNCLETIQIEMVDKGAVFRKDIPNVTSENKGISKITITLTPSYTTAMKYSTNLTDVIAFQPLPEYFTIDISNIHHEQFFKCIDDFCECEIFNEIAPEDDFAVVCINLAARIICSLSIDMEVRRLYNNDRINFGTIGLKIGDEILFENDPEQAFEVACGNGTPTNGGTLIRYQDRNNGSISLKLITRKIMGNKLNGKIDIYEHWTYKGKTLRAIFEETKVKWVVPIDFGLETENRNRIKPILLGYDFWSQTAEW